MMENSTLIYLVDDMNLISDTLLTSINDSWNQEDFLNDLLSLLEYDPGTDLVHRTISKANTV